MLVKPLRMGTMSVCMLQALGIAMSKMRSLDSTALKTWLKGKRIMVVDDMLVNRCVLDLDGTYGCLHTVVIHVFPF